MTTDGAVELLRSAIYVACLVVGPPLAVALLVGLVVGVLQAATQVNEASISFVTKLVAIAVTFIVLGSWTLRQMADYTSRTFASISDVTR